MSWNSHMELHYQNTSSTYPYNSAGSFIEYFQGLTYEHVNFIFDGASHLQESVYPSMNASYYKFGMTQPGSTSYYDHSYAYEVHDHGPQVDEFRRPVDNFSPMAGEQDDTVVRQWGGNDSVAARNDPVICLRRNRNSQDYQVIWQDNVDPDNMTYEELLELGEAVGTRNRGLSQELISLLPVSKHKCSFFSRRKRKERCVICQMEYKRGERQITLPCKHIYHADCGARWLSINKACPICYAEVLGDASKHEK